MSTAMLPTTFTATHSLPSESLGFINLLIVEDDRPSREACRDAVAALECRTTVSDSAQQALWLLGSENIDVVLLGLKSPCAGVLRQIKEKRSAVEVIVMTNNPAAQAAVEAMKAGASDYLIKPFGLAELRLALERIADQLKTKVQSRQLSDRIKSNAFGGIIGRAPEMDRLYRIISKSAQSTHPVLILGESGRKRAGRPRHPLLGAIPR
jgi:DNA-binding NtrC family response regulator